MTRRVVNYAAAVARWEPDASDRLQRAALELFVEQGFAQTTVPQITARAGLTTRTYFRHFPDKREVLFAGEEELPDLVKRLLADAHPGLDPMDVIVDGIKTGVAPRFEGLRDDLRTRRAVVQSDEGLRERELRKLSVICDAAVLGLLDRGVDPLAATVLARVAVTIFDVSLTRWLDDGSPRTLPEIIEETAAALRSATRSAASTGPGRSWQPG